MRIGMSVFGIVTSVVLIVIWTKRLDTADGYDQAAWRYVMKLGIGLNMLSVFLFVINLGIQLAIGAMR